jgi:hypothetical protein
MRRDMGRVKSGVKKSIAARLPVAPEGLTRRLGAVSAAKNLSPPSLQKPAAAAAAAPGAIKKASGRRRRIEEADQPMTSSPCDTI